MKIIFPSCLLFILVIISYKPIQAQCTVDAGPNKIVCVNFNGIDTISIGLQNPVTAGSSPYTYAWEANYQIGRFQMTASDFLNDTTLAQPSIVTQGPSQLTFTLKITDSLGQTCRDSMKARFSTFGQTLQDKFAYMIIGDTVQLYPGVSGGIPPIRYQWYPGLDLSDSSIANPLASPSASTNYVVTLTDSAGCQATDQDSFEVYVNTVGLSTIKQLSDNVEIYPNPITSDAFIQINSTANKVYKVEIFDMKASLIDRFSINGNTFRIKANQFKPAVYLIQISAEEEIIARKKITIY